MKPAACGGQKKRMDADQEWLRLYPIGLNLRSSASVPRSRFSLALLSSENAGTVAVV